MKTLIGLTIGLAAIAFGILALPFVLLDASTTDQLRVDFTRIKHKTNPKP